MLIIIGKNSDTTTRGPRLTWQFTLSPHSLTPTQIMHNSSINNILTHLHYTLQYPGLTKPSKSCFISRALLRWNLTTSPAIALWFANPRWLSGRNSGERTPQLWLWWLVTRILINVAILKSPRRLRDETGGLV